MEMLKDYGMLGKYCVREVIWTKEEAKALPGIAFAERPVLDIRVYRDGVAKQGITLTDDMLTCMEVLLSSLTLERGGAQKAAVKKGRFRNVDYEIQQIYGTLAEGKNCNILFSKTAFAGNAPKYDIRPWTKDLSGFMLGVSLTEEEFGDAFTEILMRVDADRKLIFPKMVPKGSVQEDMARTCFAELVYQFDKLGVCFGKDREAIFERFFLETREFMRNWPNGKLLYEADRT